MDSLGFPWNIVASSREYEPLAGNVYRSSPDSTGRVSFIFGGSR
jgi:hypothetical protein